MTLDTDPKIDTGRTWRDLPDAPPERDVLDPVADGHTAPPAAVAPPGTTVDTITQPTPPVQAPPAPPPTPTPAPSGGGRSPWPWVIAGAVLVAVVAMLFALSPWSDDDPGIALPPGTEEALAGVDEPVADVATSLLPSVVQIERAGAVGSGFVYADGRVLTAAHVVAGAREVTIRTSDGRELSGTVLGGDSVADVAVVSIDQTEEVPVAALAIGETPRVGQMAVAIGSPLGFEQSVTSGIVSAVDRSLDVGGTRLEGLIQTDAPINQGNSGGPLADRDGRVIGVNVAIATASGGSDGLGFAVGIDEAVEIADRFTIDNAAPETLDPGAGSGPLGGLGEMLPPELQDLLDQFLGGGGPEGLTPDAPGGSGDLFGDDFGSVLDLLDLLFGEGTIDGLGDSFGSILDLLEQFFGGN